jgi:hypothetical protein
VPVRVFLARTAEVDRRISLQLEFSEVKTGVLAGEHKRRRQAAIAQRLGDRRQFDGFRPGADDQPYVRETQSSPYLGGEKVPPLWTKLKLRYWQD